MPAALLSLWLSLAPLSAGEPSQLHNIAQVGDGGGIRTVIFVSNRNQTAAQVSVTFRDPAGAALALEIDGTTASQFDFQIPAFGSRILTTSGNGDAVRTGWASLVSDLPVGAQTLFEIRSGGALVTQAAVEDVGPLDGAHVVVDQSGGQRVGLAVVNLGTEAIAEFVLTLRDLEGNVSGDSVRFDLAPQAQRAVFLDELFAGLGDFQGTVKIRAGGSFTAIALQQTGLVLGTVSPVEIP